MTVYERAPLPTPIDDKGFSDNEETSAQIDGQRRRWLQSGSFMTAQEMQINKDTSDHDN